MTVSKASFRVGRRRAAAGLLGGAIALAAPHVARAVPRAARFGHGNKADSHFGKGAAAFADAVAQDPNLSGVLRIQVFAEAQVGDDVTMLKGCIDGTLDGAFIGTSVASAYVPEIGVINAPYLFPDARRARSVMDGDIGKELMELSRAKGLPVLAFGENGIRHVTSNTAVRTPADLRGLKIRTPQSDIMVNGFRALGALPRPLPFGLLRDALVSGEFQAQENAISIIETAKLYEVQKYLCLTGHGYDAISFIASADLLDDLTDAQRQALARAARKGAAVTRDVSDGYVRDGVARLRSAGMTVIDDVDIQALRAAARPFLEGLGGTYGAERIKALMNAGA